MPKSIYTEETVKIPEDVTVEVDAREVTVKGKYGELHRSFKHLQLDVHKKEDDENTLIAGMWLSTPTQRAALKTFCSHIENMITGVTKKFQYKMRFVYNHFPINVDCRNNGTVVEIRNFLGEKRTRAVKMIGEVTCEKSTKVKDELIITGISVENVSRSCALLHQNALVRKKDIRQFLDGIYVSEKGCLDVEA